MLAIQVYRGREGEREGGREGAGREAEREGRWEKEEVGREGERDTGNACSAQSVDAPPPNQSWVGSLGRGP